MTRSINDRGVCKTAPATPSILLVLLLDGISVGGQSTQERVRVHPCNVCDKAFKSLRTPNQHTIWQHSGHVFVCKKFKTNNSINRHKKLVCGKPHHRKSFCNSPCWARGEVRKMMVLSNSRKRADILYYLNWKSINWFLI